MDLSRIRARFAEVASGFSSGQKTVTAIAVVAVIIGVLGFTQWAAKPAYEPLFSDLESADAAAITEELTAQEIEYELTDGGKTILVPSDAVYQARIDMSSQGLPEGGSAGYALLDKQGITTSEFRQRVDYQRALEGELAKTIGVIDGVEAATVHLVIPAEDVFAEDAKKPSASVLVQTQAGKELNPQQVQGIVHLVSSSVESMDPTLVTLTDGQGQVLNAPGEEGIDAAAGDARTQQTKGFEDALGLQITEMLTPVVGADKAIVRVSADLDFDQRQTMTERFDPNQAPALTETTQEENFTGSGSPVGGVLGPDAQPIVPGGPVNEYGKNEAERTFAVSKVTEEIKAAPGAVQRMSVAVLLDGNSQTTANPNDVERLVVAAAGLDTARGDTVEVSFLPFDASGQQAAADELAAAEAARVAAERQALYRQLGVLALVLLVLFLAWRSMRKAMKRTPIEIPVELAPIEAEPIDYYDSDEDEELILDAPEEFVQLEPPPPPPEAIQRAELQSQVGDMIESQPEEVAQLLRGWLADRRS